MCHTTLQLKKIDTENHCIPPLQEYVDGMRDLNAVRRELDGVIRWMEQLNRVEVTEPRTARPRRYVTR